MNSMNFLSITVTIYDRSDGAIPYNEANHVCDIRRVPRRKRNTCLQHPKISVSGKLPVLVLAHAVFGLVSGAGSVSHALSIVLPLLQQSYTLKYLDILQHV